MGAPVSRPISHRHHPAPGDPNFLTKHPTPESLVVQASAAKANRSVFPTTLLDRQSKRLETFGKRIFSSSSQALQSVNSACLLDRYIHGLWVSEA